MNIPTVEDINKDYIEVDHNKLLTNNKYIILDNRVNKKYIKYAKLNNVVITETLICYCFNEIYQKINGKIFLYNNMYINLPRLSKQNYIKFYRINRKLDSILQKDIILYNYEKTKKSLNKKFNISEDILDFIIKDYIG
jgi:cytidylate kinase